MSPCLAAGVFLIAAFIGETAATFASPAKSIDGLPLVPDQVNVESAAKPADRTGESKSLLEKLPTVEAVMSKASDTLTEFAANTQRVEKHVVGKQEFRKRILAAWKHKYENKLRNQVASVRATLVQNMGLKAKMGELRAKNKATQKTIGNIRSTNGLMREALVVLLPKVKMAHEYLYDTLNMTHVSQAAAMEIMTRVMEEDMKRKSKLQDKKMVDHIKKDVAGTDMDMVQLDSALHRESHVDEAALLQMRAALRQQQTRESAEPTFEAEGLALALLQQGTALRAPTIAGRASLKAPPLSLALLQQSSALASEFDEPQASTFLKLESMEAANEIAAVGVEELSKAINASTDMLLQADKEGQEAAERLKTEFLERYKKADRVKEQLLLEQASINSTCTGLTELGLDLQAAQDFVGLQGKHLTQNLHIVQDFMQNVDMTVQAVLDAPSTDNGAAVNASGGAS